MSDFFFFFFFGLALILIIKLFASAAHKGLHAFCFSIH